MSDLSVAVLTQVSNAAEKNASGVLIYPDPADYTLAEGTHLFGHVGAATFFPDHNSLA